MTKSDIATIVSDGNVEKMIYGGSNIVLRVLYKKRRFRITIPSKSIKIDAHALEAKLSPFFSCDDSNIALKTVIEPESAWTIEEIKPKMSIVEIEKELGHGIDLSIHPTGELEDTLSKLGIHTYRIGERITIKSLVGQLFDLSPYLNESQRKVVQRLIRESGCL